MSFDKFTDKARKVLVLAQEEALCAAPALCGYRARPFGFVEGKRRLSRPVLDHLGVTY